jgi:L-seryl-tRNA(Ser) seleniumtransferase
MVGGGSLPEEGLPTATVALRIAGLGASALAAALRKRGIVARVEDRRVLLDPRTIEPSEDDEVLATVRAILEQHRRGASTGASGKGQPE